MISLGHSMVGLERSVFESNQVRRAVTDRGYGIGFVVLLYASQNARLKKHEC